MKSIISQIISVSIIAGILFINIRTLTAFLEGKGNRRGEPNQVVTNQIKPKETNQVLVSSLKPKIHEEVCISMGSLEPFDREKKYVILRFDDIGATTNVDILKKIVSDTKNNHAPLVLGIVGEGIDPASELFKYLAKEHCNIEYAIHGWDHFSAQATTGKIRFISEFSEISYEDAIIRLKKALRLLESLSNDEIITFTPPYNQISQSGALAVKQMGLSVISRIGSGVFDSRLPDYSEGEGEIFQKSKILESCDESFNDTQICVILLHIDDFLIPGSNEVNGKIYDEYLGLLEDFSKNGVKFTTFKNLKETWPDFLRYSLTP